MEARHSLHCLHLNDHRIRNQKVEAVSCVEAQSFVFDRQADLASNREPSSGQFVGEAMFIGGFQQARTQRAMNLDRAIQNLSADSFQVRRQTEPPRVVFVSFVVFVFQYEFRCEG